MYDPEKNLSQSDPSEKPLSTNTQRVKPSAPNDSMMRNLWLRMAAIYPHKWSSACGETFDDSGVAGVTWQSGLQRVTASQIADGLRACVQRDDPWPPTLPEFHKMCIGTPEASTSWQSFRADRSKMPGPNRLQWHRDNIAHVKAGGELPRDVPEPGVRE